MVKRISHPCPGQVQVGDILHSHVSRLKKIKQAREFEISDYPLIDDISDSYVLISYAIAVLFTTFLQEIAASVAVK